MTAALSPRRPGPVPDKLCEAAGCAVEVPSSLAMCEQHWRMVPLRLRGAIARARAERRWDDLSRATALAVRIIQGKESLGAGRKR